MKCENCGVLMFDKPLSRTNPTGQPNAGWMCQDCMKREEPELYQNLKDDGDFKITNDIFSAINDRPLMTKNECGEKCPKCGAEEVGAMSPRTVYACGSSDYDQRPNTFKQSEACNQS